MDDNLYQDDFEEFLKGQTKNQRLYPSDAVWRNIDKELHGDKTWPALTIAAFTLLVVTIAVCLYFSPKPNIFALQPAVKTNAVNEDNQKQLTLSSAPFLQPSKDQMASSGSNLMAANNIADSKNEENKGAETDLALPLADKLPMVRIPEKLASTRLSFKPVAIKNDGSFDAINTVPPTTHPIGATISASSVVNDTTVKAVNTSAPTASLAEDANDKNMVDDFLNQHKKDIALFTTKQVKSIKNRFSYLIYVAPSISYRKLGEDNSVPKPNSAGPVALNYVTDVNNVVHHKPGTGVEIGGAILYNFSDKLRIKSGLQFNVRQYNIEAYTATAEPASITLRTSNGPETINTFSIYRTTGGFVETELVNRYFQVSVPVGVEWEVIGNKNIQLNVAGSIQPTYLLNKNAYLLTTDFKNYTENKGMINSWNINSSIETYISFKVGDYKWQIGPQLRYQHLPTYIREYPIKEHLMDYGLKVGVSKIIF